MRQSCTFSWPIRGIIFLYVNGCRSFTVHQGSQGFHQSSAQTETIVARTWTFSTYTVLWPQAPECLGGFRVAGAGRQLSGQLCGDSLSLTWVPENGLKLPIRSPIAPPPSIFSLFKRVNTKGAYSKGLSLSLTVVDNNFCPSASISINRHFTCLYSLSLSLVAISHTNLRNYQLPHFFCFPETGSLCSHPPDSASSVLWFQACAITHLVLHLCALGMDKSTQLLFPGLQLTVHFCTGEITLPLPKCEADLFQYITLLTRW